MKYDKSKIMKDAWYVFNANKKSVKNPPSFSWCLSASWKKEKEAVERAEIERKKLSRTFEGFVENVPFVAKTGKTFFVNVDMDSCEVSGNTYAVRISLKEMGCRWNSEKKVWVGDRNTMNKICATFMPIQ